MLAHHQITEEVDCRKSPLGPEDLDGLLDGVERVLLARGTKLLELAPGADKEEIVKNSIGRSGTLRAPTLRQGKTLVVGFHSEAYASL